MTTVLLLIVCWLGLSLISVGAWAIAAEITRAVSVLDNGTERK